MIENLKPEPTVDNKLELQLHLSKLHSDTDKELTDDLILAYMNDKDKKYVIESAVNSYYGGQLYRNLKIKAKKWKYNKELEQWEKTTLSHYEIETIEEHRKGLLNSFMRRIRMILGTNRNVKKNPILRLLSGYEEEEKEEETKRPSIIEIPEQLKPE